MYVYLVIRYSISLRPETYTRRMCAQKWNLEKYFINIQGDSLARGPKQIWEKYSTIWRNAFKCAWM